MLDKNFSYKHMLGHEILPELQGETNPFGGVPKNDKDYRAYRTYYESAMRVAQQRQGLDTDEGFIKISFACETKDEKLRPILMRGRNKPEHMGSSFTYCCDHCIHTDPVNPEVIRFLPFERGYPEGYFICATCFKLLESKKLDMENRIHGKCALCVAENLSEILKTHPDRFIDLSKL